MTVPSISKTTSHDDQSVYIYIHPLWFVDFSGTRASLEAEGLIPHGIKWPQDYRTLRWQDDQFNYALCRVRPPGAKGSRKAFAEVDWFCLRQGPKNHLTYDEIDRVVSETELKELIYRRSSKGIAESSEQSRRYWNACKDELFQAFKATIPGLAQKKRGRHCMSSAQAQESQHE